MQKCLLFHNSSFSDATDKNYTSVETGSKQKRETADGKLTVKLNKRRLLQGDVRYKLQNRIVI
ncbi:hypothetical protein LEMLEM_LOCUS11203 [Lemmus lemmus]